MKITFKEPSKELFEAYVATRDSKGQAYAAATALVESIAHGEGGELDTVAQRCEDLKTKEGAAQLRKYLADLGKTTQAQPRKERRPRKVSTSTPPKDRGE